MGGTCSTHGRDEICIKQFDVKPEGNRQFRRTRHSWDINIRI